MKTALVLPTIRRPDVLKMMRYENSAVRFFVATSPGSPLEIDAFLKAITNCDLLGTAAMDAWHTAQHVEKIQLRNLATLEALKWGAELIVSIDDDNFPISENFLDTFYWMFATEPSPPRLRVESTHQSGWFNPGVFTMPRSLARGIPFDTDLNLDMALEPHKITIALDNKIGVAQGTCFGEPDVWAKSRLEVKQRTIRVPDQVLASGVLFRPGHKQWTMFNSQVTAIRRELVPCFFMVPGIGRMDDIVASLVTQRVMREHDYDIHFGPPFVYQQRNPEHDHQVDHAAEQWGHEMIPRIVEHLTDLQLDRRLSVFDLASFVWISLFKFLPQASKDAINAWIFDVGTQVKQP